MPIWRMRGDWQQASSFTIHSNGTAVLKGSKPVRPKSRWVAPSCSSRLPVVKAFNNIYAQHLLDLGRPVGAPGRIALPVAADVEAAKAVVLRFLWGNSDSMALMPVDWIRHGGNNPAVRFTPRTSTRQV